MNSQIFVSVCIPVYNGAEFIKSCLFSLVNQVTAYTFEIIIVDDGSKDETVQIINDLKIENVKLIENKGNKGNNYSRNIAIENAKGKYILISDADDISHPSRIQTQVHFLENNPQISICYTSIKSFGNVKNEKIYQAQTDIQKLLTTMLFKNIVYQPSVCFRKLDLEKKSLIYNLEMEGCGDYDLWNRALQSGLIIQGINYVLVYYRIHNNQISVLKKIDRIKNLTKIVSQNFNFLGIFPTLEETENYVHFFYPKMKCDYKKLSSLYTDIFNAIKKNSNSHNENVWHLTILIHLVLRLIKKKPLNVNSWTLLLNITKKSPSLFWKSFQIRLY